MTAPMAADDTLREILATLVQIEANTRRTAEAVEALRAELPREQAEIRTLLEEMRGAPRFGSF